MRSPGRVQHSGQKIKSITKQQTKGKPNMKSTTAKRPVHGQYNRNGYEVWLGDQLVYSAGNHVQDSTQPALREEDRLPLKTIRQFRIKTAREIAREHRGRFVGVERAEEDAQ
jgi:hypothetical protein